ncbi:hypothetical protein [Paenibacillus gansuensis]|uniref:DUF4145 domain-containing protein n=1 Tax=Paenibacillus gansuensis TaxID=306542 RepID=A0ABW5PJ48_9BACL
MLRDMEQLVISIKDYEIRNYMAEALRCYNAGSYRACVILSFVSGMYDLKNKILSLSTSVPEATELMEQINDLIKGQSPYEQNLIDGAQSIGIIQPYEYKALLGYKDVRNSCAHPGGHQSSPEEARNVFAGIYDFLLSKPPRIGFKYKAELLEKIKSDVFFPDPRDNSAVSEKHFNIIHSSVLPTICRELISVIKKQEATSIERKNAALLVSGFTRYTDDDTNMKIQSYLPPLLDQAEPFSYVLKMLESNIEILRIFDKDDQKKIIRRVTEMKALTKDNIILIFEIFLSKHIDEHDRLDILCLFLNNRVLSPIVLISYLENEQNPLDQAKKQQIIDGLCSVIDMGDVDLLEKWEACVEKLDSPQLDKAFFDRLQNRIDYTSTYKISNDATLLLQKISKSYILRISNEMKVNLVLAVLSAARKGAKKAEDLISTGFKDREELFAVFSDYIKNGNLKSVYDILRDSEHLINLFVSSNQLSELEGCLTQLNKENGFRVSQLEDFSYNLKKLGILEAKCVELEKIIE